MADKSFGLKQVNLINASGTPRIESPNNLNINAVNVAISTDITVGGMVSLGTGTSISSPATNVLTLGTNSVERVRITSDGNVGINTTPPSDLNSATKSIFINDRAAIVGWDGQLSDMTSLTNNFYYNSSGSNIFIEDGWANKLDLRDGTLRYSVSTASGTAGGTASIQEKVRFLSGGGITFNGDTAAANALDDYEEGDHVCSVTAGTSGTITLDTNVRTLNYVKIGNLVTVQGRIDVSSVSSPVGELILTMPFNTINSQYRSHNAVSIFIWNANGTLAPSTGLWVGWMDNNSNLLRIRYGSTHTPAGSGAAAMQTSTEIRITNTYRTA